MQTAAEEYAKQDFWIQPKESQECVFLFFECVLLGWFSTFSRYFFTSCLYCGWTKESFGLETVRFETPPCAWNTGCSFILGHRGAPPDYVLITFIKFLFYLVSLVIWFQQARDSFIFS